METGARHLIRNRSELTLLDLRLRGQCWGFIVHQGIGIPGTPSSGNLFPGEVEFWDAHKPLVLIRITKVP